VGGGGGEGGDDGHMIRQFFFFFVVGASVSAATIAYKSALPTKQSDDATRNRRHSCTSNQGFYLIKNIL